LKTTCFEKEAEIELWEGQVDGTVQEWIDRFERKLALVLVVQKYGEVLSGESLELDSIRRFSRFRKAPSRTEKPDEVLALARTHGEILLVDVVGVTDLAAHDHLDLPVAQALLGV